MNKGIQILFLMALLYTSHCDNKLEKNVNLNTTAVKVNHKSIPALELFLGTGNTTMKPSFAFEYNFGKMTSIVGDNNSAKWGIPCKDTKEDESNSCVITGEKEKTNYYKSGSYTYKEAELYLRFSIKDKLKVKHKTKMPVELVTGGQKWANDTLGVLGMSPNGDFASYVRKMFNDDVSLLFGYSAKNLNDENRELVFNTHVVQSPFIVESYVVVDMDMDTHAEHWNYQGTVSLEGTEWNYLNTDICFNSTENELIIIADQIVMCDDIKKKICDGKFGNECKKDNADFSKAPNLDIVLAGKTLTFKGIDYLFYNKNDVVDCRFGDISNLRPEELCSPATEIGLGKLFFNKYMPILTYKQDGGSRLSLISEYQFVDGKSSVWFIISIILIIVAIGVILFILLKRKRTEELSEGDYERAV